MAQIGLQMYTMRKYTGTKEEYTRMIQRVSEIGYRSIQVTKPAFFEDEEFIDFLSRYSLRPDSVFLPTGSIVERIGEAAAQAKIFGVDVLRTDSIPVRFRSSEEGYREYAKILNEEGKACRDNGLKLMYHFHAFEWIRFAQVRGMDILLNETDPRNVYFQPDVFWLACAGLEPSNALEMFAGRMFSIHVKDYAIRPLSDKIESVPWRFALVGEGNLNWKGIRAAAEKLGVRRFVVEQDECYGDAFEAIEKSFRALKEMGLEA